MSNRFDVLERFAPQFQAPETSFEGFLRRRDRKRRNQRVAAGIVGILFFVAPVAFFAGRISVERTQTPGAPGPTMTNGPTPSASGPTVSPRPVVGLIGLPAKGATPSTPSSGELVLGFTFGHTSGDAGRFHAHVYADGRLIWQRIGDSTGGANEPSTGLVEQRLTPKGVELVRSAVLSTGLVDHDVHWAPAEGLNYGQIEVRNGDRLVQVTWGDINGPEDPAWETPSPEQVSALQRLDARLEDPASWLPASAWADQEMTAYIPSRYSVCYEGQDGDDLSRVLASLPPRAEDLHRTQDITRSEYTNLLGSHVFWCSDMTTDEARAFAQILDGAGQERHEDVFGLRYGFAKRGPDATEVSVRVAPLLPHEA
jgi:hypothetical protein